MTTAAAATPLDPERSDLLTVLADRRWFLRNTLRGLTDDQARERTTISELTLGGLIKHVAIVEASWAAFITGGAAAMDAEAARHGDWSEQFVMLPNETVDGLLAMYDAIADATTRLVHELPDLDVAHALPEAPWFPPGGTRSARHVLLHLIGETAHHAGHADILREAIDGAKSMG